MIVSEGDRIPAPGQVLTGLEVGLMADTKLRELLRSTNIFARMIPEQKLRLFEALKANGRLWR